jgi:hypothetical protein
MPVSESTEQFQQELSQQLDDEFRGLLGSELDALERIARLTQSIEGKLTALYAHKFPKSCAMCGRVYQTREDFLDQTLTLAGGGTAVHKVGVQEYRNCVCGSTLMVWTKERRDNSEFGHARRALFDACLEKLKSLSKEDEAVLRKRLREVFRTVSDRLGQPAPGNSG